MKKILMKLTMLIGTVLALSTCSIYALDVVDDLSGMLVVVNDGRPIPVNGGVVTGEQIAKGSTLDVTSIDLYIPFVAPSDNVIARLALLCSTADLSVSGSVQAGAFGSGIFYPHYDLNFSEWDYGYSTVGSNALTNTAYQVDTSSVPAADFAWFVHIRLSGSATLLLSDSSIARLTSSFASHSITIDNKDSSISLSQRNGSFTLRDFNVTSSSGSYRSYYDSNKYVLTALSGIVFKASAGQTVTLSNGDITGTATNRDSSFNLPSQTVVSSGSLSRDVNTIRLSASRNDDDAEAVAELQKANATLTKISGDMDKFVSHQQEVDDTANNIGGTTSEDTISNTSTDFNSGSGTLDDFTDAATDQLDTMTAAGSGYAALMAAALPVMLNFGPGSLGPLHIALLVIVAVMGITFFIRRLL